MNARMKQFLRRQNECSLIKSVLGQKLFQEQGDHTRLATTPNNYEEHDIGNKNIRYPDGRLRSVQTRKVKEPGGRTFYVFPEAVLS